MDYQLEERTISGLHNFLVKKLPVLADDDRILDVGCGSGAWLKRLDDIGYRSLAGVDLEVPDFGIQNATIHKVDLAWEDLPFDEESFSLATSIEVIEHIENVGFYLSQINRVLKPDGLLLLTTPNTQSLLARLRFLISGNLKSFDQKGEKTHISPIFIFPFLRILSRHGFKVESMFYYPEHGISVASRWPTKVATVIARSVLRDRHPGDILCMICRKQVSQK